MSVLFEPFEFAGIRMRNRFVRSATVNNLASEEKRFTPRLRKLYADLAGGGVGLIMGGAYGLRMEWDETNPFCRPCLELEGLAGELRAVVDEAHELGAAFVAQLSLPRRMNGKQVVPLAPGDEPEEIDEDDIADIKSAMRHAAAVVKQAGCDGAQIHCCHGTLLSCVISPLFNRRTDRYGGSAENRARLLLELAAEIKDAAGEDFPVMVKMNASDFRPDGMTLAEGAEIARLFAEGGLCAIEPSGGGVGATIEASGHKNRKEWREGYFVEAAAAVKAAVDVPVMAVGGLRSLEMMEEVVESGKADLISMSRAFIREPGLVNRWLSGDTAPAHCISCGGCLAVALRREPLRCAQTTKADGSPR